LIHSCLKSIYFFTAPYIFSTKIH